MLQSFAELRARAQALGPKRVAVVDADDDVALGAAAVAARLKIAIPVLIGDEAKIRDRSLTLGLKLSQLLDNEHSLVGGGELEAVRRTETRTSTRDGVPLLTDFGENLQAKTTRAALYLLTYERGPWE